MIVNQFILRKDELLKDNITDIVKIETEQMSVVEQINKGEIDMQISTAKRFPRSLDGFYKNALSMATFNVDIASSCNYLLKRQGKNIEGPSIRLAEIACAVYGNSRSGAKIVETGENHVVAKGYFWDLENNVAVEKEVRRRIVTKEGRRYSEDMIAVTSNAACSLALRNAVFSVIPRAYIQKIAGEAKLVMLGKKQDFGSRVEGMVSKYSAIEVTVEMLLDRQKKEALADLTVKDLEELYGAYVAIKDDHSNVVDEFPPQEKKDKKEKPRAAINPIQEYNLLKDASINTLGLDRHNLIIDEYRVKYGKDVDKCTSAQIKKVCEALGKGIEDERGS